MQGDIAVPYLGPHPALAQNGVAHAIVLCAVVVLHHQVLQVLFQKALLDQFSSRSGGRIGQLGQRAIMERRQKEQNGQ